MDELNSLCLILRNENRALDVYVWAECHRISRNNLSRIRMGGAFPPFIPLHGTHWDELILSV